MRIFAADRISGIMQRLGMEEGVPIESDSFRSKLKTRKSVLKARTSLTGNTSSNTTTS